MMHFPSQLIPRYWLIVRISTQCQNPYLIDVHTERSPMLNSLRRRREIQKGLLEERPIDTRSVKLAISVKPNSTWLRD
jgi:hypothetical protein